MPDQAKRSSQRTLPTSPTLPSTTQLAEKETASAFEDARWSFLTSPAPDLSFSPATSVFSPSVPFTARQTEFNDTPIPYDDLPVSAGRTSKERQYPSAAVMFPTPPPEPASHTDYPVVEEEDTDEDIGPPASFLLDITGRSLPTAPPPPDPRLGFPEPPPAKPKLSLIRSRPPPQPIDVHAATRRNEVGWLRTPVSARGSRVKSSLSPEDNGRLDSARKSKDYFRREPRVRQSTNEESLASTGSFGRGLPSPYSDPPESLYGGSHAYPPSTPTFTPAAALYGRSASSYSAKRATRSGSSRKYSAAHHLPAPRREEAQPPLPSPFANDSPAVPFEPRIPPSSASPMHDGFKAVDYGQSPQPPSTQHRQRPSLYRSYTDATLLKYPDDTMCSFDTEPSFNRSSSALVEVRRNETPLPELAWRARKVESRLDQGRTTSDAASSKFSFAFLGGHGDRSSEKRSSWSKLGVENETRHIKASKRKALESRRKTQEWLAKVDPPLSGHPGSRSGKPLFGSRKARLLAGAAAAILVLLAIGIGLGVSLRRKPVRFSIGSCVCENGGTANLESGLCSCNCIGRWGGAFCHLDATCVRTKNGGFTVAQGFLDITITANSLFAPAIERDRLAVVVNSYLGVPESTSSCKDQLDVVALPNLPRASFPNRLAWSQAVILWTVVQAESTNSGILHFAASRNFASLGDVAAPKANSNYQILANGYIIDFGTMQVSTPPVSWAATSSPPPDQAAWVSTTTAGVLDRISSAAVAASARRATGLSHYFAELNFTTVDLSRFRTAMTNAEIVFPFDASRAVGEQKLIDLASTSTTFPPGIGCFPGLSADEVAAVNFVEAQTFGLPLVTPSQSIDLLCTERPLYGILNFLNLRLPFPDADLRSSLPKQGAVVTAENSVRMSLHAGELLVAEPTAAPATPTTSSEVCRFGTFAAFDHIILDWLHLIDDFSVAQAVIEYVLGGGASASSGPSSTLSSLTDGFSSLPILEVQLWGGLRTSDVDHVVSGLSLASSNASLLFGSAQGDTLRSWALGNIVGGRIDWAPTAESTQVVRDAVLRKGPFLTEWQGVSENSTVDAVWAHLEAQGLTV